MSPSATNRPPRTERLYFAVWRWHFYAGLFVIPFLLMLALTGAFMMTQSSVGDDLGAAADVAATGAVLPASAQAKAALAILPEGNLSAYVTPVSPTRPAFVLVAHHGGIRSIAVNPYTGAVLASFDPARTWRALAIRAHARLFLGTIGDRLIEAASSMAILMVLSGLYLWWPIDKTFWSALVPDLSARGRGIWKELHKTTGIWISLVLLAFLLSGLSWTGVWGAKYVKPWSVFLADRNAAVPLSDLTHADLNQTALREVPWALEAVPLPASGSDAGTKAVSQPVVLDTVAAWAAANGFSGQYKIALPAGDTGVYTVSVDDLHGVGYSPTVERYVHIDRYSGNVLADIQYADYRPVGKVMAWAIGLHKGEAGPINYWFNIVYLVLVIFLCTSGVVMWWKRRPAKGLRLCAPPLPTGMRARSGLLVLSVLVLLAFPMAGITLLAVIGMDTVFVRFLPTVKRALS